MCLLIPDDILKQAGLSEREALIEIACRLFDAERLEFNDAMRLAGLERVGFEAELRARGLAVTHYTQEDYEMDREAIEALRGRV
ncbi:MAG: UPF0175 family protein, partial [Phycisphaerales bacterium]|nr:UPF0175 family protein [Phycisphaerales bacterium]